MRRRIVFLGLIVGICAACLVIPLFPSCPLNSFLNWGMIATILVTLTILALLFEFDTAKVSSREIAVIAMLSAVSVVSRIPFAAIPSVQPCTFLIACSGYVFGPIAGFMVGAITALVSNFFLGQGPWTPYQMFAWGLVGITAAGLRHFDLNVKWLIAFGIIWGYLFGWITNTWFWTSLIYPLTFRTWIIAQLNSVWFDTLHAISNAVLLGFFGMKTIAILERYKKHFSWVYSPEDDVGEV